VESSSDSDSPSIRSDLVETTAVVLGDIAEECKGIAEILRGGIALATLMGPVPLEITLRSGGMVISAAWRIGLS